MSEGRPPRGPFPSSPGDDEEEVRIDTDPAPAPPMVRAPIIPPPPRLPRDLPPPREPFRVHDGGRGGVVPPAPPRMPTLGVIRSEIEKVRNIQQRMAIQLDGFGVSINSRFDLFHEELALLRATVTQDHAPRLSRLERAKQVANGASKAAAATLFGSVLTELWPQYEGLIHDALRLLAP